MAQWVKVLAAKTDDLVSIPRTYMKERTHSQNLFSDLHLDILTNSNNNNNNNNKLNFKPPHSTSVLYLFISDAKWIWL